MFKELLIKEFLLYVLDRKYAVYVVLAGLLLVGSFYFQKEGYQLKYRNHTALDQSFRENALNVRNYWGLLNGGIKVSCAPPVLQSVCRGTEALFSKFSNIALTGDGKEAYPFLQTEKYDNPVLNFFPVMDLPLIVTFILSLMVFLFSYSCVSREREAGTLKLLLSYPVPRAYVILSKLISGYTAVILPLVFSFILYLLVIALSPQYSLSAGNLAALGGILFFSMLYLLVLNFLGIFISILCRKSATAIALLLLIWIVFIIVFHNLSIMALERGAQAHSVSRVLDFQERVKLYEEIGIKIQEMIIKKFGKKDMREVDWEHLTPQERTQIISMELDIFEQSVTAVLEQYVNQLEKRNDLLTLLGFCSPSLLFTGSVTELADTGIKSHIRLLRSILEYHRYFKQSIEQQALERLGRDEDQVGEREERPFKNIRQFQTPVTPLGERAADTRWSFFALCCYAVLFFLLSFISFLRMDAA